MKSLTLLLVGVLMGVAAALVLRSPPQDGDSAAAEGGGSPREPLYWVAPMDPSYRRDGPGKSPMGMDLVPVYADDAAGREGLVRVAPEVVSTLGVRTAEVRERTLRDRVSSVGYVGYDEDRVLHVHPRVSGWVEKLHVKAEGEQVTAGAPLYALYSPQLVSAQEELALAVQQGVPELVAAARERLRSLHIPEALIARLLDGGAVSQAVTFTAPQSGVLEHLGIREGFFVEPNMMLVSIAPLDPVWVEVELFESQAAQIATGLPVTMSVPYFPGREWRGEVDYVYPALDPRLRTLRLRLRFANPDRQLRPNMFARVAIRTPEVRFLAVPEEAVIRLGDGDRVVRVEAAGAYRSVPVHLGRSIGGFREVLHGLALGDTVVTSAQFLLDSESSKSAGLTRLQAPAPDHADHMQGHTDHAMPPAADPMDAEAAMHEHAGHAMPPAADPMDAEAAMHEHAGHAMPPAADPMDAEAAMHEHAGHAMPPAVGPMDTEAAGHEHAGHAMPPAADPMDTDDAGHEHAGHAMPQGGHQHD